MDDDPRAPYKVYEGQELRGKFDTRAAARRLLQKLERQQLSRPEPHPICRIEDRNGQVVV